MYPNLKMEIWLSGIRQNRLARELHVDETLLSKVVNGYREPSRELRALLAEYFNKSEGWLFQAEPARTVHRAGQNGTAAPRDRNGKSTGNR